MAFATQYGFFRLAKKSSSEDLKHDEYLGEEDLSKDDIFHENDHFFVGRKLRIFKMHSSELSYILFQYKIKEFITFF